MSKKGPRCVDNEPGTEFKSAWGLEKKQRTYQLFLLCYYFSAELFLNWVLL